MNNIESYVPHSDPDQEAVIAGAAAALAPSCSTPKNIPNSTIPRLPKWLAAKVANPPKAGSGVHRWLFTMSLQLHGHLSPDEIERVLTVAVAKCGRTVDSREIGDAVDAAAQLKKTPRLGKGFASVKHTSSTQACKSMRKWPSVNSLERLRIISENPMTEHQLSGQSPVEINEDQPSMEWFLQQIFSLDSLLCVGKNAHVFKTLPLQSLVGSKSMLEATEFIVPSPMIDTFGVTKKGKRSMHTLSNTGPRRYLVTEFDSGTPDEQSAIIWHLREYAPLVMVLRSGGKSLHGWWACVGVDEAKLLKFFRYAVSLGADPATWTRSQFVRIPQGWRADKQALQQVLYFNPSKLPVDGGEA
jgi:hypothetical protein